ncbi:MAG TPA: sugar phosphate isomerase/epimerase [Candidatus Limnocylindrales bacterium]|nr:sugar phosphate isomerase/epimerase [Candidatus Limnocylindrales bacterium]
MELGLYTDSLAHLERESVLDVAVRIGATAIEISTGGQSSAPHLDRSRLLRSPDERARLLDALASRGLHLAALNCSAWLLHPRTAAAQRAIVEETFILAELLGVDRVVTMSGCPGDGTSATTVNWPVYPWPDELVDLRRRQWDEMVTLWRSLAPVAADHGVRVALELHPLQLVFNVPTLLELRAEVGETIGANLDPSHLFWQQMDPLACIAALGPAVHHVHLKDTALVPGEVALAGVLDVRSFENPARRAWNFRTVGRGHDRAFWTAFVRALAEVGYGRSLSIEHEDRTDDPLAGVEESASVARDILATTRAPGERPPLEPA